MQMLLEVAHRGHGRHQARDPAPRAGVPVRRARARAAARGAPAGRARMAADADVLYRIGLRTFSAMESWIVLGVSDAYELPRSPGHGYIYHGYRYQPPGRGW